MSQQLKIMLTGTFDLQNYGDLLFPLVAESRLARYGYQAIPVATSARRLPIEDAVAPIDLAQMMLGEEPIAGILVGGGHLIHASSLNLFMDDSPSDGTGALGLWLGATLAGALRDVPIAWNAVGVPHPFSARQRDLIGMALGATSYLSVRDRGSARLLGVAEDARLSVVPDSIADIGRLWPKDSLASTYHNLLHRKGISADARLLAFHVRNRSMTGLDPGELGAMLRTFARTHGLVPALVAVGHCHDDARTARLLAPHLGGPLLLLDDPISLREITSVFAHGALYVGASLHGYIVSSAYDTPAVIVARPAYQKFFGFLEHTGRTDDMANDWPGALEVAALRAHESPTRRIPATVLAALDTHWESIRAAFSAPRRHREARRDFALSLLRFALRTEGPGWALRPFQNLATRASDSTMLATPGNQKDVLHG
jgi:hypothetical protein